MITEGGGQRVRCWVGTGGTRVLAGKGKKRRRFGKRQKTNVQMIKHAGQERARGKRTPRHASFTASEGSLVDD